MKAAAQHSSSELGSAFTLHFICTVGSMQVEAPHLHRRRQIVEPQAVRASPTEDTRTHRSTNQKQVTMTRTSRQRLPYELTMPRKLHGSRRSAQDVPIGTFYRKREGGSTFLVCRQRKANRPCTGCYFYESVSKDHDCPDVYCEDYRRADRCNVIFKKVLP